MKEIRIIQVSKIDMAEILDPLSTLFDKYRQFYRQSSNHAESKSFIKQRIENQDSVIFAAPDNDSRVLGFAQLYPSFSSITVQRKWILNDLYVSNNFRRQGVAGHLLNRVDQHAAATLAGSIFLETQVTNVSAQKLYESLGYKKEEEHYTYFIKKSNR